MSAPMCFFPLRTSRAGWAKSARLVGGRDGRCPAKRLATKLKAEMRT